MNFTQEQIEYYNTGFKEGFEAGNNMLSIGATKIDDIRNFLAVKGKGVFYENGYLRGYMIGHKIIKNEKNNIMSKGNFDINTLTSEHIKELMKMNMENEYNDEFKKNLYDKYNRQNKRSLENYGDDGDDDDGHLGLVWNSKEREFIKEEERKQKKANQHKSKKSKHDGGKSKRKSKKRRRRTKKSKK